MACKLQSRFIDTSCLEIGQIDCILLPLPFDINVPMYDRLCYRSMPLRVAVIGAGAAGLCALRHLTARPSVFTALGFEQTSNVGGGDMGVHRGHWT